MSIIDVIESNREKSIFSFAYHVGSAEVYQLSSSSLNAKVKQYFGPAIRTETKLSGSVNLYLAVAIRTSHHLHIHKYPSYHDLCP